MSLTVVCAWKGGRDGGGQGLGSPLLRLCSPSFPSLVNPVTSSTFPPSSCLPLFQGYVTSPDFPAERDLILNRLLDQVRR